MLLNANPEALIPYVKSTCDRWITSDKARQLLPLVACRMASACDTMWRYGQNDPFILVQSSAEDRSCLDDVIVLCLSEIDGEQADEIAGLFAQVLDEIDSAHLSKDHLVEALRRELFEGWYLSDTLRMFRECLDKVVKQVGV